jgi:glycerate 2-kinase
VTTRVLAAPDKFRGTASAGAVAAAIAEAAEELSMECRRCPMSDGGEGILEVFGGPNRWATVTGPQGTPVRAGWRLGPEGPAVVESALASGLVLAGGASGNDPVAATSRGTGELIAQALDAGAGRVLVGLGGSATTDGGVGAVEALRQLIPGGHLPADREVVVCCDVTTRFVDAAKVFAPQKGADPGQVAFLAERLERQAEWLRTLTGVDVRTLPGSGAAGGLAGGLAAIGAKLVSGFDHIAAEVGLADAIAAADLVVTGEGAIDAESFNGKVVGGITAMAQRAGVPVLAVAGVVRSSVPAGLSVVSLSERFGEQKSFEETLACVRVVVAEFLRDFAP